MTWNHYIMTIVGLFFIYVPFVTIRGVLKVANLHCSHQQCVVAEWSGRSVTVRVRVRAREWDLLWHGVITQQ